MNVSHLRLRLVICQYYRYKYEYEPLDPLDYFVDITPHMETEQLNLDVIRKIIPNGFRHLQPRKT